ncbi:holo-ACP synthase [Endothiovibrio diazotrophicus]
MIVGIGVDLVRVERLKRSLERFGERFAKKVLGADELEGFRRAPRQAHFLAKRFAAKEAVAKAFGTGFRDGLTLPQIQVENDPLGRPLLSFSGRAAQLIAERGVTAAHLSLSDEEEHAIAYVILEQTASAI